MAQLFKHIIPFHILAQMPLSFVHRLRDVLRKDKEEQARQYQNASTNNMAASDQQSSHVDQNTKRRLQQQFQGFSTASLEDFITELE